MGRGPCQPVIQTLFCQLILLFSGQGLILPRARKKACCTSRSQRRYSHRSEGLPDTCRFTLAANGCRDLPRCKLCRAESLRVLPTVKFEKRLRYTRATIITYRMTKRLACQSNKDDG